MKKYLWIVQLQSNQVHLTEGVIAIGARDVINKLVDKHGESIEIIAIARGNEITIE